METYIPKVIPSQYPHVMYKDVVWDEYNNDYRSKTADYNDAEVVSSELTGSKHMHAPVLDLDLHAALVPSSTEGHYHLYIDRPISWRKYKRLLRALANAGIIEQNYLKFSLKRRHSSVRVPWRKKDN